MTTYNTYQEAKIANPEEEILKARDDWDGCECYVGKFIANKPGESGGVPFIGKGAFKKCNPADYCMTVEKFLADGHKFVGGDVFLNHDGDIVEVGKWYQSIRICPEEANLAVGGDENCYILRAAALEEELELTKDDSPQGVISRVSNRLYNMGCEYQDSKLGEELGGMACEIWGVLPLISNESIKEEKPFLQTGEDFEHSKTLNFIRDRLVEVHGEPKNPDYMHKLNNAIAFVERMEEPSKLCSSGAGKEEKSRCTKVTHEKLSFECAWRAVKAFEDGEKLYTKLSSEEFALIDNAPDVLRYLYDLHERVETEITEREEFIERCVEVTDDGHGSESLYYQGWFKCLYDNGCRFVD